MGQSLNLDSRNSLKLMLCCAVLPSWERICKANLGWEGEKKRFLEEGGVLQYASGEL